MLIQAVLSLYLLIDLPPTYSALSRLFFSFLPGLRRNGDLRLDMVSEGCGSGWECAGLAQYRRALYYGLCLVTSRMAKVN